MTIFISITTLAVMMLISSSSASAVRYRSLIRFMGLDNSGKTTMMYMLHSDLLRQHAPTIHPILEQIELGSRSFLVLDGSRGLRHARLAYVPVVMIKETHV